MTTTSIRLDTDLVDKVTIMAKALNRTAQNKLSTGLELAKLWKTTPIYSINLLKKPLF
jgi:predicted transcriptional regulator